MQQQHRILMHREQIWRWKCSIGPKKSPEDVVAIGDARGRFELDAGGEKHISSTPAPAEFDVITQRCISDNTTVDEKVPPEL